MFIYRFNLFISGLLLLSLSACLGGGVTPFAPGSQPGAGTVQAATQTDRSEDSDSNESSVLRSGEGLPPGATAGQFGSGGGQSGVGNNGNAQPQIFPATNPSLSPGTLTSGLPDPGPDPECDDIVIPCPKFRVRGDTSGIPIRPQIVDPGVVDPAFFGDSDLAKDAPLRCDSSIPDPRCP